VAERALAGLRARQGFVAADGWGAGLADRPREMHLMRTGKVKWFNAAKGFGFIADDQGGDDVFVHFSAVEMDGYKDLKEAEAVEYDAQTTDKGLKATRVVRKTATAVA